MDASWWPWIALVGFLVFCCIPMLFMGKHNTRSHDAMNEEDRKSG